jgi:hypothetical protein
VVAQVLLRRWGGKQSISSLKAPVPAMGERLQTRRQTHAGLGMCWAQPVQMPILHPTACMQPPGAPPHKRPQMGCMRAAPATASLLSGVHAIPSP